MRRPIPTDCRAEAAFQDIARASGLGICPWLSLLGKSGGPGKRSQISRGQKMSWALSLVATSQPHIDRVSLDLSSWAWPLPPTPASHIPCPLHGATCCFLACALNITPPCLCLCLQNAWSPSFHQGLVQMSYCVVSPSRVTHFYSHVPSILFTHPHPGRTRLVMCLCISLSQQLGCLQLWIPRAQPWAWHPAGIWQCSLDR